MECAVITTYRCNARCRMCESWKNPSLISEEFNPKILEQIPPGMQRLNITGGEPMMRQDIFDIVEILNTKTRRLEISTNGYFTDRILAVAGKFPSLTVRVSIEGLQLLNDRLRGIKDGFEHAHNTVMELKRLGLRDIGFAMVISHNNIADLLKVYRLSESLGVEFSQSAMHNSFYFFKHDNRIENLPLVERHMIEFIRELLKSKRSNWPLRVKDWFRAYINAGLLRYMKQETRAIPCYAGTESFFVDPRGMVLACNGSGAPWVMGDLNLNSFEEIWHSPSAEKARKLVAVCRRACWMTGSSVPAMRKNILKPLKWVAANKIRLAFKRPINEKI